MTNEKGIFIKNIYYMLTYAFQVLKQTNYEDIASEEFEQIESLFAAILAKGISQQLKQGLYREYVTQNEVLPVMRGKLDMRETMRQNIQQRQVLACEFDELSENNIFNQILKTTAMMLIRMCSVDKKQRKLLKKAMLSFEHVDTIEPSAIRWNMLRFQRNNKNYQMLLNICYFVLEGLLQTTEEGNYRMASFLDEHMVRLFERFVLEYYRCHYSGRFLVAASQIKWNLGADAKETAIKSTIKFLPVMQTDIMLQERKTDRILIIDTKYYTHMMQSRFHNDTFHSNNLYQIFAYVKNQDVKNSGNVSGMLLYAKTGEEIVPDAEYFMGGNRISVKTLDLNDEFKNIASQLAEIVETNFGG